MSAHFKISIHARERSFAMMLTAALLVGQVSEGLCQSPSKAAPPRIADIPAAVRKEMESLSSDDPARRAMAAASLGEMGEAARPAIPLLIAAIDDYREVLVLGGASAGRSTVGTVAIRTLSSLGEPARVALLKAAEGENPAPAIMGLGVLEERRAIPILERYLLRPDRERYPVLKAVPVLQKLANSSAFEPLAKALLVPAMDTGSRSEIGGLIVTAMVETGGERATTPIIEWLNASTPDLFLGYADGALQKLKDPRLAQALVAFLQRGARGKESIFRVLGAIGDPTSVDVLIDFMDQQLSFDDSRVLYIALEQLTGKSFQTMNKTQALTWWKQNRDRVTKRPPQSWQEC